jgi:hypothetical protein
MDDIKGAPDRSEDATRAANDKAGGRIEYEPRTLSALELMLTRSRCLAVV